MGKWKRIIRNVIAWPILGCPVAATAGYSLHREVKNPTPALKRAAQIGALRYDNGEMAGEPDRDALLILGFGTTYKETREKTIDVIVEEIRAAHEGEKIVLSFTSQMVIDQIKKNEGIVVPDPREALEDLLNEGYTRIAIASLDIFPGIEYGHDVSIFEMYKANFKRMVIGTPLLYWMGQEEQRNDVEEFVMALERQIPARGDDEAVLLLAHGTRHPSNAYYAVIQMILERRGIKNVYLYTLKGWPQLSDVMSKLKTSGVRRVTLMPMMVVAGEHVTNDMSGGHESSHKSILESMGFEVETYLHGLGENEAIREMFADRADEAWKMLKSEE